VKHIGLLYLTTLHQSMTAVYGGLKVIRKKASLIYFKAAKYES